LERLRKDDPTAADVAALDRRSTEVERKQGNLRRRLATEDDDDLAAMFRADLLSLRAEQRQINAERDALIAARQTWQNAQHQLDDLDRWVSNVAGNLDDADYRLKRLALTSCRVHVKVWAKAHAPRWQATMQLGDGPIIDVVYTTM
jgi:hypothetical protein